MAKNVNANSGRLSKKKKVCITVMVAVLACAVFMVGGYVGIHKYIQNEGIVLRPGKDVTPADVPVFLQNDPQWGDDCIGKSSTSMASAGCLISAAASAINHLGVELTPGQLNEALTKADGFDGAILLWNKLAVAVPGINYRYSRIFSSKTIDDDLANGRLPLVKVRYQGSGMQHWVLVVGAKDGDYLIIDPLNSDKTPIPLQTHGRVYAYRVIILADA